MKILFASPCAGGQVHHLYARSLLSDLFLHPERLAQQHHYNFAHYLAGGYSGLGKDRGMIASYALREGFDKLFFMDADQSWSWEGVKKLVDSSRPIVAGMVAMKKYPLQLNFAPHPDNKHFFAKEGAPSPIGVKRWREANPGADELRATAVGTGMLCIDVKVLKSMAEKGIAEPFDVAEVRDDKPVAELCWDFFATGVVDRLHLGEDFGFAVLAQRAGFEVYVNTSVAADHHGQHTYTVPPETWAPVCDRQQVLPLQDACEK